MGDLDDFMGWLEVQDEETAALVVRHAREFAQVHRLVTRELMGTKQQQHERRVGGSILGTNGSSSSSSGKAGRILHARGENSGGGRHTTAAVAATPATAAATSGSLGQGADRRRGKHRQQQQADSTLRPHPRNHSVTVDCGRPVVGPPLDHRRTSTRRDGRRGGGIAPERMSQQQQQQPHRSAQDCPQVGRILSWSPPCSAGGETRRRSGSSGSYEKLTFAAAARRQSTQSISSSSQLLDEVRLATSSVRSAPDASSLSGLGPNRATSFRRSRSGSTHSVAASANKRRSAPDSGHRDGVIDNRPGVHDPRMPTGVSSRITPAPTNMRGTRSTARRHLAWTAGEPRAVETAPAGVATMNGQVPGRGQSRHRRSADPEQHDSRSAVSEGEVSRSILIVPGDPSILSSSAGISRSRVERQRAGGGGKNGDGDGSSSRRSDGDGDERHGGGKPRRQTRAGSVDGVSSSGMSDFFTHTVPPPHHERTFGRGFLSAQRQRHSESLPFSPASSVDHRLSPKPTGSRPAPRLSPWQQNRIPSALPSFSNFDYANGVTGQEKDARRGRAAKEDFDISARPGSSIRSWSSAGERGGISVSENGRSAKNLPKYNGRRSTRADSGGRKSLGVASRRSPSVAVAGAAAAAVPPPPPVGERWLRMRDPVSQRQFYFDPETRAAEWEDGGAVCTPGGLGLGLLSAEEREKLRRKFERRQRRGPRGGGRVGSQQPGLRERVLRKMTREGNGGGSGGVGGMGQVGEGELQSLPEDAVSVVDSRRSA